MTIEELTDLAVKAEEDKLFLERLGFQRKSDDIKVRAVNKIDYRIAQFKAQKSEIAFNKAMQGYLIKNFGNDNETNSIEIVDKGIFKF